MLNSLPDAPPLHVSPDVTVPVWDDPVSPAEVENRVQRMRWTKLVGQMVFSMLPAQWVSAITSLINAVLMSGVCPASRMKAKMFTVCKRGSRSVVDNYRGFSVINSISKLHDRLLCDMLKLWFRPFLEQPGEQSKRGCVEHFVALRRLTDVASYGEA